MAKAVGKPPKTNRKIETKNEIDQSLARKIETENETEQARHTERLLYVRSIDRSIARKIETENEMGRATYREAFAGSFAFIRDLIEHASCFT